MLAAAALAVLLQAGGLVARLTCPAGSCSAGAAALARRWDMDELGSVPRAYTTALFLAVAVVAAVGVVRCARAGARPWWTVLALTGLALCLAKAWSVHALVEVSLGGVLSEAGIQLVFVAVAAVGLTVVLLSGSRVRQDTRTATLTWLVLYAAAGIGLAAVTNAVWSLGAGAQATAVFIEETSEALAAVGLLAVVLAGVRDLSARRG
ncbi:MAG: rane protein of unknown function [Klenkia sp.]|nr:rane protein of unknown function [Klenkia sp.]